MQRINPLHVPSASYSGAASPKCAASAPEQLKSAKEDIKELLGAKFCHPILVILDCLYWNIL